MIENFIVSATIYHSVVNCTRSCLSKKIYVLFYSILLRIFDICWVSTAVVLVKNNVLLLAHTGMVLEFGFPKSFLI